MRPVPRVRVHVEGLEVRAGADERGCAVGRVTDDVYARWGFRDERDYLRHLDAVLHRARASTNPHGVDLRALGLRSMPDAAGLRRAWRSTAKRTHPDAGGSDGAFIVARAAFERLAAVVQLAPAGDR